MVRFLFTDYWKVVGLNFWEMGSTVFLWAKKMMERWYLLITEMFLFWTFQWWETWSFFSQNVEGKMVFTWSFWAFHDIPGLGQYGFSCNDCIRVRSAHNVIPILWIKSEYVYYWILSTSTHETENGAHAWPNYLGNKFPFFLTLHWVILKMKYISIFCRFNFFKFCNTILKKRDINNVENVTQRCGWENSISVLPFYS